MAGTEMASTLVACDDCDAPHPIDQVEAPADGDSTRQCPQCGNESFTPLHDPSSL